MATHWRAPLGALAGVKYGVALLPLNESRVEWGTLKVFDAADYTARLEKLCGPPAMDSGNPVAASRRQQRACKGNQTKVTIKEFLAIEKRLLPGFPGFALKGPLMFIHPLGDTLRGFNFEPSAFSKKEFYVNMFFLPLFVPTKRVHFTFGHRVGGKWSLDRTDLESTLSSEMQKEVPFLTSLKTAKEVVKALEPLTKPNKAGYVNPYCPEALAYALVRAGESTTGADVIDALLKRVNRTVAWERDVGSRARLLLDKLLEKPGEADKQLAAWEAETIRNLGMEAFTSDR